MTRDDLKVGVRYKRKGQDTFRTITKIDDGFVKAMSIFGNDIKLSIKYFLEYYELAIYSKEDIKQLIAKLEL